MGVCIACSIFNVPYRMVHPIKMLMVYGRMCAHFMCVHSSKYTHPYVAVHEKHMLTCYTCSMYQTLMVQIVRNHQGVAQFSSVAFISSVHFQLSIFLTHA